MFHKSEDLMKALIDELAKQGVAFSNEDLERV
jgi:hypothetical protein